HPPEQARFGFVLYIADRERTNTERAVWRELGAVCHHVQAFDSRRRHRVYVGYDEETARSGNLRGGEDAHPCAPSAEGHLALRQNVGFPLLVTAVSDAD